MAPKFTPKPPVEKIPLAIRKDSAFLPVHVRLTFIALA